MVAKKTSRVALADFQVAEPASLLTYSAPPTRKYSSYAELQDEKVQTQKLADEGKIPQKLASAFIKFFSLLDRFFERRPCPEGIFAQNLNGFAKHLPTTQDHLPITQKSTGDWFRSWEALLDQAENVSNLAFMMDGAVSFIPLSFSHMFLDDSGACSSLDFALRLFSNEVDMTKWHCRELVTHVVAEGRTFSESRLWNEEGKCVCSMTQQAILRPKKGAEGRL